MNILKDLEIVGLSLFTSNTLILADIHIGYEEALNKQGILVPRLQFKEMVDGISKIFNELGNKPIERIIVNGDLKHEFGTISEQEWRNTLKFLDLLSQHCKEIILVKGNHDNILGPIAKKRNVKVSECYVIGPIIKKLNDKETSSIKKIFKKQPKNKILIAHGDKIPDKDMLKDVSTIIIGHEHPAVSVKEGPRVETFKCFLKGTYKGKNLIVQPSFNTIIEGTDILKDKILSPFLKQNLDNFEVYVVEDKTYNFGKLKNLK